MVHFLLNALTITAVQIIGVLGIFFLFGWLLSRIQTSTQRTYARSVGWKGILWTGWIGTPIHELGHAFFAVMFRHKIVSIALFTPNQRTGELGHVNHEFDRFSLYQRMGNFFIGAAPMIWGIIILVICLYWLVPNSQMIFVPLTHAAQSPAAIVSTMQHTLLALFSKNNLQAAQFWIFLYISFCIASHIAPSREDQKSMWGGFVWIALILLGVNIITLALGMDITNYIIQTHQYLGIFIGLFIYSLLISLVHYLIATVLLHPFRRS